MCNTWWSSSAKRQYIYIYIYIAGGARRDRLQSMNADISRRRTAVVSGKPKLSRSSDLPVISKATTRAFVVATSAGKGWTRETSSPWANTREAEELHRCLRHQPSLVWPSHRQTRFKERNRQPWMRTESQGRPERTRPKPAHGTHLPARTGLGTAGRCPCSNPSTVLERAWRPREIPGDEKKANGAVLFREVQEGALGPCRPASLPSLHGEVTWKSERVLWERTSGHREGGEGDWEQSAWIHPGWSVWHR